MDLNQVLQANESYEYAHSQVKNILLSVLEAGEITQENNNSLDQLLDKYNENYNIIKDLGQQQAEKETQDKYDKLDQGKLDNSFESVIGVITQGGKDCSVGIDSEGKLIIDDKAVPKLKLVELEVDKIVADVIKVNELVAQKATIEQLNAVNAVITNLQAKDAEIENLVAGKATIDQLEALNAEIENLVAGKATIDQLEALNAIIENLKVNDLTAINANIQNLVAKDAEIETLVSQKATIEQLNATNANITALNTTVANIQTLVGGNLTMDNIKSLTLTAGKVTVDNAFIKSAMIDTVSANQINGGKINTNLVNIQSDDGSMVLNGTLQQFKDKNGKVRIQMGKDAQGNFTFLLLDETGTGTIMDANGITSKAVPNGLIVDSMVSNNAGISGDKLDIDSVITEVNGSTTTLKASKIKFDDKNQTLDVAFNTMTDTVTTQGKTLSTQSTNISTMQGQISTLISNTTVTEDGTDKTIKEAYNALKLTVGGLSSKMGEFETTTSTIQTQVNKTVKLVKPQYYSSTSNTTQVGGSWIESNPQWKPGYYIWQRLHYTYTDGTTSTGVATCIQGAKGEDGADGTNGSQGPQGVGIQSVTEYYAISASNTTVPTNWSTTIPRITAVDKYLWNYEKTTMTDGTSKSTTPVVIGAYGDKGEQGNPGSDGNPGIPGKDGVSITNVTNYYLATDKATGILIASSGWTTDVQNVTSIKKYLWNYESVLFSDNTRINTDPCIIGTYGEKGDNGAPGSQGPAGADGQPGADGQDGQSVTGVTPQFQKHTNNTTAPTGTWLDTCPAYESGKYLWIRNKVVFANPVQTKYTDAYYEPSWDAKSTADAAQTTVTNKVAEFTQTINGFGTKVQETETKVIDLSNTVDENAKMEDDGQIVYIKDKLAQTSTTVDGITSTVSNLESNFDENGVVTNMTKQVSQLQQVANQFNMDFWNKFNDSVEGVTELHDYITFSSEGITIGQENYPVKLMLTKDRIKFVGTEGQQLAYFSEGKLYVNNAEILSTIKIANYGFLPTAGGSLTIAAIK